MKRPYRYFGFLAALLPALLLAGCAGDTAVPPVPVPEGIKNQDGVIGQGTWNVPLTVYQASIGTLPEGMTKAWVSGYIVGSVNSDITAAISEASVEWEAPFSKKSNVLLAADPECRDLTQVIAVGFTYGYDARSRLNLADNPQMLGKKVSVYGTTGVKYFGEYGMRNATFYKDGNEGIELDDARFSVAKGELPDGVYSLYRDGYIAHTMTTSSYLYGYIATMNSNVVSAEGPKGSFDFTFTKNPTTGHYTIRQSDGRYLTRNGGSANWAGYDFTENPADAGAQWSVTPNEDGTYAIRNVSLGSSIRFDMSYSSFGLYPASSDRPYPFIVKQIK